MIKYLQETQDDKMTLKISDMTMAYWYDGADFVVHADMKICTGGVLTMGKGEIFFNEAEDQHKMFYESRIGNSK